MQRRRLLSLAAVTATLTGCGFQLRQTGDYPFKTLLATYAATSPLGAELTRQLRMSGRVQVLTEVQPTQSADLILDLLQEQRQRVVVGLNAAGQVRELELRMTVKFRLRSPDGVEWIEPEEIYQRRDLSFTETLALSKGLEEALLYKDMQDDIVRQILRRLTRARPPGGH